jgi:hypothetical protein
MLLQMDSEDENMPAPTTTLKLPKHVRALELRKAHLSANTGRN